MNWVDLKTSKLGGIEVTKLGLIPLTKLVKYNIVSHMVG